VATARVDKRRVLLDAATKVVAERGYHECRVGTSRPDVHPHVASWVLRRARGSAHGLDDGPAAETPEDVAAAVDTVVTVVCDGLVSPQ
jgi:hypothetical protein